MISYIKGELTEIYEDTIVVENNNIGYNIRVPMSLLSRLPHMGSEVKIYTYMYVREDILDLYGFLTRDDLDIFKMLITVSGIGPKGALSILSAITPDDLRFAVLSDDVKTISSAPGIGTKTAQKLIIELKGKIKLEDAFEKKLATSTVATESADGRAEAVSALVALGYSNSEAAAAVKKVEITEGMDTEEILKLSLKHLAFI